MDVPPVVDQDDDDICQAVQMNASFEQLRDLTLINFSNADDIKLFVQLVTNALGVAACVCLNGLDYIANNTNDLWL